MEWQHPRFLYLILPLCVGWLLLALYSERRRQQAKEAFVAQAMWSRVMPESSQTRFWIKTVLRELAIVSGLLALAGPRFGVQYEKVVPRGSDLYVLIDVSRSMLADDVVPSRLERAKADVSALVNRLEGERIGLVAFAGQAVVKCPLTVDYDSFRRALNELDPNSAPRGGTAIGDAIRKALEVFHSKTDRDQAVLLITDGDDQESYPLEAATVAAERKVTIFTVGLGDSSQGSRIPQKANASTYIEHDGQQVWSKLDGKLLEEIAIKTSGIYIPAGTRAYDLGELYANHLQGRKGDDSATQQRIRRSERFQIFLAMTLLTLLADLCISPYRRPHRGAGATSTAQQVSVSAQAANMTNSDRGLAETTRAAAIALLVLMVSCSATEAGDSHLKVREGLELYRQEQYEAAGKQFAAASEELDKEKSAKAAIAAFDEACAYHRKGDLEKARDRYLQAGLSPDRSIATSAHFNLGTMSAEQARRLAGERPEEVPADKRQEILDELKQAVGSYRHCLELQPDHTQSRRNLELVRNWIKYYSDRWQERDRQKLRDETSLIQFLEFLIQTQTGLQETAKQLPEHGAADAFAELKRAQDELSEEIPTLREKIESELRPKDPANGAAPQQNSSEISEGITLLQSWANKAGDRMASAANQLARAEPGDAVREQQAALDELDRIWDAVIPFHPLLAKELTDQTTIAEALQPAGATLESPEAANPGSATTAAKEPQPAEPVLADPNSALVEPEKAEPERVKPDKPEPDKPDVLKLKLEPDDAAAADPDSPTSQQLAITAIDVDDLARLAESQNRTLRKARLLGPKAAAELSRLESMPAADVAAAPKNPAAGNPVNPADPNDPQQQAASQNQVDPEELKAGYRKAIELAPKAVDEMQAAVEQLEKKDPVVAAKHAEEARRILEEMQKAQPKNEQQQDQQQQEQEKKDQEKKEPENKDQQEQDQKNEEQKKDGDKDKKQDEKKSEEKKSDQKKNEKSKDDKDEKKSEDNQKSQAQQKPQQVSQDRIEEALRKVRERQQEKRERDREARARVLGRTPVDKDW